MAYYEVPTVNDTSGFYELAGFVNRSATGGLFFPIILLVIWAIIFFNLKNYSTARAWTTASFISAVISIFLAVMDFISPRFMYLCIFLTLVGFVWLKLENAST